MREPDEEMTVRKIADRPEEGLDVMQRATRLNPRVPSVYRLVLGGIHIQYDRPCRHLVRIHQTARNAKRFLSLSCPHPTCLVIGYRGIMGVVELDPEQAGNRA